MLCNPTDDIVYGILQARILEWVDFPFSRGSSQPWDWTQVSCIAGGFFTSWGTREASIGMLLFSHYVVSDSLWPYGLQHTMLPCPSLSPGACSNPCPLSQWCYTIISSSVTPFSFPQSFPASGSFQMSQLFASGGQTIGALATVLPTNIQGLFPLGLTSLISLLSKTLSRVFSSTTIWKHQFFGVACSRCRINVRFQMNDWLSMWYRKDPKAYLSERAN